MSDAATTMTDPPAKGDRSRAYHHNEHRRLWLTTAVAITLLLTIAPMLITLGLSFTNTHLSVRGPIQWTTGNWTRLLQDEAFYTVLWNTLFFVVVGVTLQYVLGLTLAISLDMIIVKGRWLRAMLLIPMMVSPIAVGFIIGRMMLGPEGPVVQGLDFIGISGLVFFREPTMSKFGLVLVETWQWTPLITLILLAGLQTIPRELKQAAYVDGATEWQMIRYIIFPLLGAASLAAIVLRMLEAFKIFDIIVAITGGGPGRATESLTLFVYNTGINNGDVAYGATAGFAMLVIVVVLVGATAFIGRNLTRVSP